MITILAGSFLLFLVQPMVARMALPRLGGAPNVWNSAMLVYQALLLAGYAYAHLLSRLPIGRQALVHLAVLVVAGLTLPITLADIAPPAPGSEALWVPWLLVLSVGPVFFAVSAQAPLMQRWFAASPAASDPYPLYAASNLGSFAGLLAYPLLAEPLLPLATQSRAWAVGFALLVVLVAVAALARRGVPGASPATPAQAGAAAPSTRTILLWLALSAVPSGLMLSTTTFLTTDNFAMPLLWVIPLGLYLLSFSVAFASRRRLAETLVLLAPLVICADGAMAVLAAERPTMLAGAASLVMLFVIGVALHSRLYEMRPEPARLTQFYLVMSAGGALGGLFTALIAPLLFDWTWEHPLLILAAAGLLPLGAWSRIAGRLFPNERTLRLALILLLFVLFMGATWLHGALQEGQSWTVPELAMFALLVAIAVVLAARRGTFVIASAALLAALGGFTQVQKTLEQVRTRSYFGIYTVTDYASGERVLKHGTTLHGIQLRDPQRATQPTAYYGATSGAGRALLASERLFGPRARVGVVGLGVGTLACYRRPGQAWTFFEIDPEVLAYSQRGQFTYLERCAKDAPVVIGDARLELAKLPPDSFDILLVDAFSSDAIPLHLLTDEAAGVYFRALADDGLLLIHISNRFVDLEPVLAALARERGLAAARRSDMHPDSEIEVGNDLSSSNWVALSRDPAKLAALTGGGGWKPLRPPAGDVWRDDFASILPHLTWKTFF
jgi:SAM-dependent methyltransferase